MRSLRYYDIIKPMNSPTREKTLTFLSNGVQEIKRHGNAQGSIGLTLWIASLKDLASDKELEVPIEDQPLPADASPTTLSPGYNANFDPKEDEEDPKEDPTDHPVDGEDNDDNESSDDDEDDDDVVKDTKAFKTDESASTPPTSPYHIILSDCPELKNQNHENGGTGARGVVHALGGGETNQDHNDMEEDINA
ncbi:hypothetical protein Tco_0497330 [Tanacetum coccineum]